MTTTSNKNISTRYRADDKSLIVEFVWGKKWIPSLDFAESVKGELMNAVKTNDITTVVLDLKELTNISSEWLWLLLRPRNYFKTKGLEEAKVIITNANKSVLNVLKITQLDSVFSIQEGSAEDILAALQLESE